MSSPPEGWAEWRADNPGATPADVVKRFGVHHATARSLLRRPVSPVPLPAPGPPTPAEKLAPDDRAVLVGAVRAMHATIARQVVAFDEDAAAKWREGKRWVVDKDQAQALLSYAKAARELTDAHPGLLELAGVGGGGALGGGDAVERLRALLRGSKS